MGVRFFVIAGLVATAAVCTGCGGTEFVNTAKLPDNLYCRQMKDVCKEAREFENNYAKLSPEEKKDAENVLKAYRMQCNDALDACRKSAKEK
jgi:hypothetical protein